MTEKRVRADCHGSLRPLKRCRTTTNGKEESYMEGVQEYVMRLSHRPEDDSDTTIEATEPATSSHDEDIATTSRNSLSVLLQQSHTQHILSGSNPTENLNAATRVFRIPELLVMVLLHLPWDSMTRLSPSTNHAIRESWTRIEDPSPDPEPYVGLGLGYWRCQKACSKLVLTGQYISRAWSGLVDRNCELRRKLNLWAPPDPKLDEEEWRETFFYREGNLQLPDRRLTRFAALHDVFRYRIFGEWSVERKLCIVPEFFLRPDEFRDSVLAKSPRGALWRGMFFLKPAFERYKIELWRTEAQDRDGSEVVTYEETGEDGIVRYYKEVEEIYIENEGGVTLGQMFDAAVELCEEDPDVYGVRFVACAQSVVPEKGEGWWSSRYEEEHDDGQDAVLDPMKRLQGSET